MRKYSVINLCAVSSRILFLVLRFSLSENADEELQKVKGQGT